MKILGSRSYCAVCNKALDINNLGAIIQDGSAHNACQDPCATEYNLKQKPVKPKENWQDYANNLEPALPIAGLEKALPFGGQEPVSFAEHLEELYAKRTFRTLQIRR